MIRSALSLSLLATLAACAPYREDDVRLDVDLRAAFSLTEVNPVGVTVDPVTGQRFVLDADQGIYEIFDDGRATQVLAAADFPEILPAPRSAFTDLAALGDGRFALTARSFGYLLDVQANSLAQFFCYEPGWMDPEAFDQSTHTLAYDPAAGVLISQPQTLDMMNNEQVTLSQIGTFDALEGTDLSWSDLSDLDFLAGGLTVLDSETLLLGQGTSLYRHTLDSARPVLDADLSNLGVGSIEGLAYDTHTETLLVLDGDSDRLIEIALD